MMTNNSKVIKCSPLYLRNYQAYKNPAIRIIVNQGGTSSGKTYSTLQVLHRIACEEKVAIEVAAITVPHYKGGSLSDFKGFLCDVEEYDPDAHNKSDQIFSFPTGSTIKFSAYENEGKARGPRRDVLFCNESNLFDKRIFNQLMLRTRYKIFIDYNPADEFHWIYDDILTRDDVEYIQSTYLDNYDFLTPQTIADIERLEKTDPDLWRVYGLGQRGVGRNKVYTNWALVDEMPINKAELAYGLDFGFNVPSSLVLTGLYDDNNYWDEIIYERGLTTPALIRRMEQESVRKDIVMYCDSAEPDRILELQEAGYNARPANKSVKAGIDFIRGIDPEKTSEGIRVKGRRLYVTKRSINVRKEISQYKNKSDKNGDVTDEPVKFMDHALDAGRYGSYTHYLTLIQEPMYANTEYL